jgi:hypothetical protein
MSTENVNKIVQMNDVRLLRVSLTKEYVGKDAKIDPATGKPQGKFHIDAVFAPTHPDFQKVRTTIRAVAQSKWKEKTDEILAMIGTNNQRFPLQKGDQYRPGKPDYAGQLYISAGNKEQPTIVVTENGVNIANRGTPTVLTPSHPNWPYDGCYANVQLEFYCYSYNGSPGLGCSVLGVQFFRHGTRLRGSSVASASEFGLVPQDADSAPTTAGQQATATGGGFGLI